MEKKTKVSKIATAWEEKTSEYWTVKNKSNYDVEYDTEEAAIKAQEFMDELNWQVEDLYIEENMSIAAVTAFFKYPPKEVNGTGWNRDILGWEIELTNEQEELQGNVEFLRIVVSYDYEGEYRTTTQYIDVTGQLGQDLINFINK